MSAASKSPNDTQRMSPSVATLTVREADATRDEVLADRALLVGRAAASDIRLGAACVSLRHARIAPYGTAHTITDIGSTNGLLFRGAALAINAPLVLHDDDVLRIGDPATGNSVSLTYHNPLARRGAVRGRRHALDQQMVTIGRRDSDIVLRSPQVSHHHARIEQIQGDHIVRDLGSTNGTFVNGQRVTQHTLALGDLIQIGLFKLVYANDHLEEYDQRDALRLDARQLSQAVQTRSGATKPILHDVSLAICPREFVALVGGSGAGKTTLLRALSGYARAAQGEVKLNGDDLYRNFDLYRTELGYVPQEDTLHQALTVERALHYAARLRLPDDTATAEIAARIERVLDDVELTASRDTLIADLSGGQRKRASIAAELLADPALFFLDEPTSGLDPGLEKKLMYTLRRIADGGRTVVLVTHATANIMQCDHVAFLSDGRLVFFGPPAEALEFFGVGDFAGIYTLFDTDHRPPTIDARSVSRVLQALLNGAPQAVAASQSSVAEAWQQRFHASPQYARYVAGPLAQTHTVPTTGASGPTHRRLAKVSVVRQWRTLVQRYVEVQQRDRRNIAVLLLQAPLIGALIALVSRQDALAGADAYGSDARRFLVILALVAVWFGVINAARAIAKETPIYQRERKANLRIGAYLASKVAVLFVLVLVQSALLLATVGLRVDFPGVGVLLPAPLELLLTTVLASFAGLALGLAISVYAATPDRAAALVPLALVPQILFAGVIFSLGGNYTTQRILSWLTISRWAMDAYGTTANLNALPLQPGLTVLPQPPAEYSFTATNLLVRWLALLVYAAVCLGAAAWMLKRRDDHGVKNVDSRTA